MAQAPAPIGIAPRYAKPANFTGTDVAWRVLCDRYPSAETPDAILAVVEYCIARRLDPLRNPVHIVPMWNAKLKRRVQVVMQGISEHEITAHRTGLWAGMDRAEFGPMVKKKFTGQTDNDDGTTSTQTIELEFPEWCEVPVYRLVRGERQRFAEQVWFVEAYGRAGFRSEVPNARWRLAPRQMLAKCAKAASLRAAFPEEVGYSAEEMEDREIESGGMTIDGKVDHGDPGMTDRDRRAALDGPPPPSGPPPQGLALLDDQNSARWLKALQGLLKAARTSAEFHEIACHPSIRSALSNDKPQLYRSAVNDALNAAHARLVEPPPDEDAADEPTGEWVDDPIRELLVEVSKMDRIALDRLPTDASWRARVRERTSFPLDEDRLNDAIAARKAELSGGNRGAGSKA